jgi:hypothetical protein
LTKLKKNKSRKQKDKELEVVPSSKLISYMSDNDDSTYLFKKIWHKFGKAKKIQQQPSITNIDSNIANSKQSEQNPTGSKKSGSKPSENEEPSFFKDLQNFHLEENQEDFLEERRGTQINREFLLNNNSNPMIDKLERMRSNSDMN